MTMITKKIYIKAAKMVHDKRTATQDTNVIVGHSQRMLEEYAAVEIENSFIEIFRGDNPKFDEKRFRAACLPEGWEDR
jgi:hypothetical protein